ncbi:hypothetical protein D3C86_2132300 [compost metagenome]
MNVNVFVVFVPAVALEAVIANVYAVPEAAPAPIVTFCPEVKEVAVPPFKE